MPSIPLEEENKRKDPSLMRKLYQNQPVINVEGDAPAPEMKFRDYEDIYAPNPRTVSEEPAQEEGMSDYQTEMIAGATPALLGLLFNRGPQGAKISADYYKDSFARRASERKTGSGTKFNLAEKKELERYKAELKGKEPANHFAEEQKLRKEYLSQGPVDQLSDMSSSMGRIEELGSLQPSGPTDMALIFNFQKMNDPESVVRESEFRSAQDAKAWLTKVDAGVLGEVFVPTNVRVWIEKASTGASLDNEQRKEFVHAARSMYHGQKKLAGATASQYKGLASQYGLNPENIIIEFNVKQKKVYEKKILKKINESVKKVGRKQTMKEKSYLKWARDNKDDPAYSKVVEILGNKYGINPNEIK